MIESFSIFGIRMREASDKSQMEIGGVPFACIETHNAASYIL